MGHLVLVAMLCAGKADPKLVGTWLMGGGPFMTLNANGAGLMEGDSLKWKTEGTTLVLTDADGGEDRATYAVNGDALTLTLNGIPLQLTRAAKGESAVKPKGKLSKKLEGAQGQDDEAEADAMRALQQFQQQAQQQLMQQQQAAQPQRAGSDQLSQLLLSSNWCYLRYASGNTYTQKVHFNANGTWADYSESDIYVSNSMGMAEANNARQNTGQWAVRNGDLLLSDPPETPQLTPIGLRITRNSNGSPILNANGREYSMCR